MNKLFTSGILTDYNSRMILDTFDHAILNIVTENNQLTHSQIGQKVNLSTSSVRRRLMALRNSGIIQQDVSILNSDRMGLTFIVHIHTNIDGTTQDKEFKEFLQNDTAVSQVYSVSGDLDYIIVVHANTSQSYETWAEQSLLDNAFVSKFTSTLVWSRPKFSSQIKPYVD